MVRSFFHRGFAAIFAALFLATASHPAAALSARQAARREALFVKVFGEKARFPRERVEQVKALGRGRRLWIDSDGDGRVDEVWFIDTARRHLRSQRPVLVRAVDEDGDLRRGGQPDLDSDLYFADWGADGTVDAVLNYTDLDGDQDVDEMAIYFYRPADPYFGEDTLCAWWAKDIGDDNLLWHDVGYAYFQGHCQWRSHFGGDEIFAHLALRPAPLRWVPTWENPFIFYDHDGDDCPEETVRFSGCAERVENIRWSMDADNDSSPRNPHDYDFSLTAWAKGCRWQRADRKPGRSELRFDRNAGETATLRGIETTPFLSPECARNWARSAAWERTLLTWDEIDYNCEGRMAADPHERWEGVIAQGNKRFPQVGGPGCGPFNKRFELLARPGSPLRLYWSAVDRRIHLRGAEEGWLRVDYDLDGNEDMAYRWSDRDRDGFFDHWEADLDGDGHTDAQWDSPDAAHLARPVALEFGEINHLYTERLDETLKINRRLIAALKSALASREKNFRPDEVERFYAERLDSFLTTAGVGAKIRRSRESARFYQDIIRDRYLARLERTVGRGPLWAKLSKLRARGDFEAMASLIEKELPPPDKEVVAAKLRPQALAPYSRRVTLTIANPLDRRAENECVEVALEAVRRAAPDFNPKGCALVAPDDWIAPRIVASQLDPPGASAGGASLVFLADCPARSHATYSLYYNPRGAPSRRFPRRTATAQDWVPPNIGWESDRCAYRSYWGQFDFFGKSRPGLILPGIAGQNYHKELEWGMDALEVGETSGIGGLTLYVNGRPYLVQNPEGKGTVGFQKRLVAEGPVRATIEIVASNVGPASSPYTVRIVAHAIAGRTESPIEATVAGGRPDDKIELGIGLRRLAAEEVFLDSAQGCFGTWGLQTPEIGRVGLGVVFEPDRFVRLDEQPAERRIVLSVRRNEPVRYLIIGDWLRGRRFDRCPTVENWRRELRALSLGFRHPLEVEIGKSAAATP